MRKTCLNTLSDELIKSEIENSSLAEFITKYDLLYLETIRKLADIGLTNGLSTDEFIKQDLYNLYITQNKSACFIAKMYNTSTDYIARCLKKVGIEKSPEMKRICRNQSFVDKYGTPSIFGLKEVRDKIDNTMIERYGNKCPVANEEVRKKAEDTMMKKYGVRNAKQSEEINERIKKINLEKYGCEYPIQNEEVKAKSRKAMLDKYGVNNTVQLKCLDQEFVKLIVSKDSEMIRNYFNEHFKNMTMTEIGIEVGLSPGRIGEIVREYHLEDILNIRHNSSQLETEICHVLNELGITNIIRNSKDIVPKTEIDIYLPDFKFGIEVNGNYWHSHLHKKENYHKNKSIKCLEYGIDIIHIYEYEWHDEIKRNIIMSIITSKCNLIKNRIYAKNCIIKEITNNDASDFNETNNLQGHRDAKITYGLYYNNELVQLMSFSKHKEYDYEIIRSTIKSNYSVIGGLSKLFKYFIKTNNPTTILAYAGFNKFNGHGYEKLGMQFIGYTKPDLVWLVNGKIFNRQASRYSELKNSSEFQIHGAGSKKYLWTKDKYNLESVA